MEALALQTAIELAEKSVAAKWQAYKEQDAICKAVRADWHQAFCDLREMKLTREIEERATQLAEVRG
jgi:hypothetical protein